MCYFGVENQIIESMSLRKPGGSKNRRNDRSVNFLILLCLFKKSLTGWPWVALPPFPKSWGSKCMPLMRLLQKAESPQQRNCGFRGHERGWPHIYLGPHREPKLAEMGAKS